MSDEENDQDSKRDSNSQRNTNDFVIRDGFPALRLPGGNGPWIDGDEPIPRHVVWADDNALTFRQLESLWQDCTKVFSARIRDDDQAYSAGVTYFLPAVMKPRCALEELVQSIFRKHTERLPDGVMIPEQSGAEWWTLVLDDDEETNKQSTDEDEADEVGMHFDADYGLEEQAKNLLLHPRYATVTYLTSFGAPTVILNKRSPPPDDVDKKSLEGGVDKGWLSHPKIGKHLAFDGRLLHGAPATFFPASSHRISSDEPLAKKAKQERRRITLLVNVWVNHCPLDAEPLEDEVCESLQAIWTGSNKDDSGPMFEWGQVDFDKSPTVKKFSLSPDEEDPAGEEEVVVCNRLVTIIYGVSMDDLHKASESNSMVELEINQGAISLKVGDEIEEENEEADD